MKLYISKPVVLYERGARDLNEDYIYPLQGEATQDTHLFIVCDGLGGTQKGDVASKIVAHRVGDYLNALPPGSDLTQFDLNQALLSAEEALSAHVKVNPGSAGMGTTLALLHIGKNQVTTAWTGNSQIFYYRARTGKLYAADGHLDVVNSSSSSYSSDRLHTIHGTESPASINMNAWLLNDIGSGDYFMICTDGILEEVHSTNLAAMFDTGQHPEKLMEEIAAFTQGVAQDNYACYLFQVVRTEGITHQGESSSTAQEGVASAATGSILPEEEGSIFSTPMSRETLIAIVVPIIMVFAALGLLFYIGQSGTGNKKLTKYEELMNKGESQMTRDQFQIAQTFFDSAVLATPDPDLQDSARAMIARAVALENQKKLSIPVATYIQTANTAFELGDYRKAIENYEDAEYVQNLRGQYNPPIPYQNLGEAYLRLANLSFESNTANKNYKEIYDYYSKGFDIFKSPETTPLPEDFLAEARLNYQKTAELIGGSVPGTSGPIVSSNLPGQARPYSETTDRQAPRSGTNIGSNNATSLSDLAPNDPPQQQNPIARKSTKPTITPSSPSISPTPAPGFQGFSGSSRSGALGTTSPVAGLTVNDIQNLNSGKQAYQRAKQTGAVNDYQIAAQFLSAAGPALDGVGAYYLAYMYHRGFGIPVDKSMAIEYARVSALKGWASGQYLFGYLLLERNNPVDRSNAIVELRKAANQGHKEAKQLLNKLGA